MSSLLKNPFDLPDWARWHAIVDLTTDLQIQIAALKFPRWEASFYPVFIGKENKPIFEFPLSLSQASKDGRIWNCCPSFVWFSEASLQIAVDTYIDGAHPMPPVAERQLVSAPDFNAPIVESKRRNYEEGGGILPRLSELSGTFQKRSVVFLSKR